MSDYKGYELHPEAYADVDELRGYIAADNPDAADRIVIEVFEAVEHLVSFPQHRPSPARPDKSSPALYSRSRIPDRLRAG